MFAFKSVLEFLILFLPSCKSELTFIILLNDKFHNLISLANPLLFEDPFAEHVCRDSWADTMLCIVWSSANNLIQLSSVYGISLNVNQ